MPMPDPSPNLRKSAVLRFRRMMKWMALASLLAG